MQSLRGLWKAAPTTKAKHRRTLGQAQTSTATLATTVLEEEEDETSASSTHDVALQETPPAEPQSPAQVLQHLEARLLLQADESMEWTEVANLYYTTGCVHANLQHYEQATDCFTQEARVLVTQGGCRSAALVPIWRSCARLWQLRSPHRALYYYQQALDCCADTNEDDEADEIRCDMGRLLFQTGHLEQAMRVSIGNS
jgi:tetratricopeptide (TPR) repeat protein